MADTNNLLFDHPGEGILRITLNRPHRRNAIDNALRGELIAALQSADRDEKIRLSIIRGAGDCFSSGYDLKSDLLSDQPYFSPDTGMAWARHVSEGWMGLWDLAKPVIAQIHGYAMAGGLELAGACDLIYAADDARLSHPVLQFAGLPDFAWFPGFMQPRQAMELHLAGAEFSGVEAVQAGLVNRVFAAADLESEVLAIAGRMATVPAAVLAVNKRYVHAAMEARGVRSSIRLAADLQAGPHMQQAMDAATLTAAIKSKKSNSENGDSTE